MRIPLSWLRTFVDVDMEAEALAERLTLAGLAVEQIIRTGVDITGVVVGEVRTKQRHPDSDRLMLVTTWDGSVERQIVCGADNYSVGDRVPMAVPGARLPGGMQIAQRPVLGIVSDGMLCSSRELAIADDHSGILLLDRDAPLGRDIVATLSLDDVVFDIDVTGNRPDALCVLGVAREVSALTGAPLRMPAEPVLSPVGSEGPLVTVKDTKGCLRYIARVIDGVTVGPSPWEVRRRLLAAGMRPISNVVDITNYVMLERGQPLHAFDLSTLAGEQIVVRKPKAGERTLTTLDGVDRVLAKDDLLICDGERPVALAGVMGGAETEVSDATTRILLESATFDAHRIARMCRRTGIRTEASTRFEHGVDPAAALPSSDLATSMLAPSTGGRVAGPATDVAARVKRTPAIAFRVARAASRLGVPIDAAEATSHLRAIGCEVAGNAKVLRVTAPSWRPDISIEENLIEEVARLYGYDRIPETLPPITVGGGLTHEQARRRVLARTLEARGLNEAVTLSLIPPSLPDRLGLSSDHPWRFSPRLANPLSEEESVLRPALIPGLLLAAQRNVARRVTPACLYEVGRVFALDGEQVHEAPRVAWIMTGPTGSGLHEPERPLDFFDAKGVLSAATEALGVTLVVAPSKPIAPFHPARVGIVHLDGVEVGVVAELHPRIARAFDLPERVAVVELDLTPLLSAPSGRAPGHQPRFPSVRRDIAIVMDVEQTAADAERVLRDAAGAMLDGITIFDDYVGDRIGHGRRSLAFALELRAPDRTLSDEDVAPVMTAVEQAVRASGWQIRGAEDGS